MLNTVNSLAREIDVAWAKTGYGKDEFSDIAARSLDCPLGLDFPALARLISGGLELPQQRRLDQAFGQPALTLYHDERFVIEALCWHTGSPAIHQHAFSGAFRVATGRSVHSRYSFTEHNRIEARISLGVLELKGVELLDDSVTTVIPQGPGLIHSAFHLDNPSMTIIVRSHDAQDPEYTYLPPGVAFDPSARSPSLHKRLQLLDTLNQCKHELYSECVDTAIENGDLYDGMEVLMRVGRHGLDAPMLMAFVDHFRSRHGQVVEPIVSALIEDRRRNALVGLRATVADENTRYFVACLLNFFSRPALVDGMVTYYGNLRDARKWIATGVRNLLGLEREAGAIVDAATWAMIDDVPPESFPGWVAALWKRKLTQRDVELLSQFYAQLLSHPLLTPLRGWG